MVDCFNARSNIDVFHSCIILLAEVKRTKISGFLLNYNIHNFTDIP